MDNSSTPVDDLNIDQALTELDDIIESFEDGEDISLSHAKELRERGEKLLTHIEKELDFNNGDGEITSADVE